MNTIYIVSPIVSARTMIEARSAESERARARGARPRRGGRLRWLWGAAGASCEGRALQRTGRGRPALRCCACVAGAARGTIRQPKAEAPREPYFFQPCR
jgi:hypothetical protein